jgi:flagella basal body P-ring formation protein FlgA
MKILRKLIRMLGLALCLGGLCGSAQAQDGAPANEMEHLKLYLQQETAGINGRVEVSIGDIDPRLQLAPCAQIEPYVPPGTRLWGRALLGVRCVSGARWNTYIPVQVRVFAPALIAARNINAGEEFAPADVRVEEIEWTRQPTGLLTDPAQVQNKIALRSFAPGQTVRAANLRERPVVSSGDQVKITYGGNGFVVSSSGRALAPAIEGQSVRVQTDAGKVLTGTARAGRIVEIRS